MQSDHVRESVLWGLPQCDVAVPGTNEDVDLVAVQGSECIFQPDAKFPNHLAWMFEFFLVLVLCQVLIFESSPEIPDVPHGSSIL